MSNFTHEPTTPLVNSVLHAAKVLELYAAQREEYLTLTEISKALSMHKTTIYRILRTLQSIGWVEQSQTHGKYRLGTGILLVASAVAVHQTSRDLIKEEMQKLSQHFNETVVLSALRGNTGICVDIVKSKNTLSVTNENGYIVPVDLGATGKTLLAAQSLDTQEKILAMFKTDKNKYKQLKIQLQEIHENGYCISEGEVDKGVAAIAMPLFMPDGIYTLSIAGPIDRLRGIGYKALAKELNKTIDSICMKVDGSENTRA